MVNGSRWGGGGRGACHVRTSSVRWSKRLSQLAGGSLTHVFRFANGRVHLL